MKRVLLVEDSADVLCLLQVELESMGYQVDTAMRADVALAKAVRTPPDVIVSDLGMPGMDGFEFIKRIRKLAGFASVPAIALTGSSSDKDVQYALAVGFTAHVNKPIDAGELARRIEQITARRLKRKAG
jgi:two-component system, chemotaxis family, CheB/CheR fusion protein